MVILYILFVSVFSLLRDGWTLGLIFISVDDSLFFSYQISQT
jgi:hypothetical protein